MSKRAQKYYWVRLTSDFFDRAEIRLIEKQENGALYICFYLKILLLSINKNGSLTLKKNKPYTIEMLSTITSTDIEVVRLAMKELEYYDLISISEESTISLTEITDMIGSETGYAAGKRKQRSEKSLEEEGTLGDKEGTLSHRERERDIDIERDRVEEEEEKIKEKVEPLSSSSSSSSQSHPLIDTGGYISIAKKLEGCNFGLPSPNIVNKLLADIEIYGEAWVFDAIEKADEKGGRTYNYVKTILENWKNKGRWDKDNGGNHKKNSGKNNEGGYDCSAYGNRGEEPYDGEDIKTEY